MIHAYELFQSYHGGEHPEPITLGLYAAKEGAEMAAQLHHAAHPEGLHMYAYGKKNQVPCTIAVVEDPQSECFKATYLIQKRQVHQ